MMGIMSSHRRPSRKRYEVRIDLREGKIAQSLHNILDIRSGDHIIIRASVISDRRFRMHSDFGQPCSCTAVRGIAALPKGGLR